MNKSLPIDIKNEFDRLIHLFFSSVSFEAGGQPSYDDLYELFIENGLLIKNNSDVPEISNVSEFIQPREKSVRSGELTAFHEAELAEVTEIFGNVAHRFSTYEKSGTLNGVSFHARGMISTQFVRVPNGWKISSMAWDDERPGLTIPSQDK